MTPITPGLLREAARRLDNEHLPVNELSVRARAHNIRAADYGAYHHPGDQRTAMPNGDGTVTLLCVGCWYCTPD